MPTELCLHVAGMFAGYFLQVTAAWVGCALVAKLTKNPSRRFWMWCGFVAGSGVYWIYSVTAAVLAHGPAGNSGRSAAMTVIPASGVSLPEGWQHGFSAAVEIVAASYVVVALVLLGGLMWRHVRLAFVMGSRIEPSSELARRSADMCRQIGVRGCELAILPGLPSPATAGVWRPRILLPLDCEAAGDAAIEDVLRHELAHVVRRDYLWATLTDVVASILFFHPLVARARRAMLLDRELACDLAVVRDRPEHRADYAECLTRFARARMLSEEPALGIDFAAASILAVRVESILSVPDRQAKWRTACCAAAAVAVLGGVALLCPALTVVVEIAREPAAAVGTVMSAGATSAPLIRAASHSAARPRVAATDFGADGHPAEHRWSARVPVNGDSGEGVSMARRSEEAEVSTAAAPAPVGVSVPQVKGPSMGDVVAATVGAIAAGADRDDRGHHLRPSGPNQP
jgi:beta-lactamase regulating signal transducer with metallopeptidase domain